MIFIYYEFSFWTPAAAFRNQPEKIQWSSIHQIRVFRTFDWACFQWGRQCLVEAMNSKVRHAWKISTWLVSQVPVRSRLFLNFIGFSISRWFPIPFVRRYKEKSTWPGLQSLTTTRKYFLKITNFDVLFYNFIFLI